MKQQKKPTRSAVQGVVKRAYFLYAALVLLLCLFPSTAFAADDPLTVVNNLSDFIFGLVRAIGMILLGFGVVQIGLSFKSHDPSSLPNSSKTVQSGRLSSTSTISCAQSDLRCWCCSLSSAWCGPAAACRKSNGRRRP